MPTKNKKPPIKESVGAMYYTFDTPEEGSNEFAGKYEEDVIKTEVVKSVSKTENGDTTPVYASGKEYDTVNAVTSIDHEIEVVAFPADDLARMRGETVGTTGLITSGESVERPRFAYGKVVKLRGGNYRYEWYPNCKLQENTDEISTKEESFSEQNDTVTIRAYPYDEKGNICCKVDSTIKVPAGLTEESFFEKPILTEADMPEATTED